jgi:hypothetical protein
MYCCEAWKVSINCAKSKVVIFSKRKMENPPVFTFNDEVIEIVDSYSYHGLVMNYNGSQTPKPLIHITKSVQLDSNNFNCKSTGIGWFLIRL